MIEIVLIVLIVYLFQYNVIVFVYLHEEIIWWLTHKWRQHDREREKYNVKVKIKALFIILIVLFF